MDNVQIDKKFFDSGCGLDDIEPECDDLAKEITSRNISVAKVVEDLGVLLCAKEHDSRHRGTWILSETLRRLPSDFLSEAELRFVVSFYCDRIKDHHQVLSAVLGGVVALADMKNLPDGAATSLLAALLHDVTFDACSKGDRLDVYVVLSKLLVARTEEMRTIGTQFVYSTLTAVDGERDPDNLLFLFRWLPTFFRTVALGHLVEDAFEAVSCYFPVDFRTSAEKNDVRDELAAGLRDCLCAVPEFAEFCVELALEKLDSDLRLAKLDSFDLLAHGCGTFPARVYETYRAEIWASIRKTVIGNTDADVVRAALRALDAVLRSLSAGSEPTTFADAVRTIVASTRAPLVVDPKTFDTANMILACVSNVSDVACRHVFETCVPTLIEQYGASSDDDSVRRASLLDGLAAHVAIHEKHVGASGDRAQLEQTVRHCVEALDSPRRNVRIAGLNGLALLAGSVGDGRDAVHARLLETLVDERDPAVRESATGLLERFAALWPAEVSARFVRDERFATCASDAYLDSICALAPIGDLGDAILATCSDRCFDDDARVRRAMMRCYRNVVADNYRRLRTTFTKRRCFARLVDGFVAFAGRAECRDDEVAFVEHLLEVMCDLVEVDDDQRTTVDAYVPRLLALYGDDQRTAAVVSLEGLLTRLRRDVAVPSEASVVDCLLDAAVDRTRPSVVRRSAGRLLSNLLNKANDPETILDRIVSTLSKLATSADDVDAAEVISRVTASTTKALVLRDHASMDEWIDKMIAQLASSESAAAGFRTVMADDPLSLNAKSDCRMSVLYKQKFFTVCCEKLSSGDDGAANGPCGAARASATAYLMEHAPLRLIEMNFSKIAAPVVRCLSIGDADASAVVLRKLDVMLEAEEPLLVEHARDFIPAFLELAAHETSMTVRMNALSCLGRYARYSDARALLPYRDRVVSGVARRLDDRKRLVRRAAAETRMLWCAMSGSDARA